MPDGRHLVRSARDPGVVVEFTAQEWAALAVAVALGEFG
jgi:hypothetical protein